MIDEKALQAAYDIFESAIMTGARDKHAIERAIEAYESAKPSDQPVDLLEAFDLWFKDARLSDENREFYELCFAAGWNAKPIKRESSEGTDDMDSSLSVAWEDGYQHCNKEWRQKLYKDGGKEVMGCLRLHYNEQHIMELLAAPLATQIGEEQGRRGSDE